MSTWPEGVGRRILTATDSTMAEAARRAEAGVPGPEWTLALDQTAGSRPSGQGLGHAGGQLRRLAPDAPRSTPADAALRSFVAALALREAFIAAGRPEAFKP
jgi:BirA family biotin operon repressor/biotin-[acetyl-CoA-carboxylase] ligase